jgi:hypothetical protein
MAAPLEGESAAYFQRRSAAPWPSGRRSRQSCGPASRRGRSASDGSRPAALTRFSVSSSWSHLSSTMVSWVPIWSCRRRRGRDRQTGPRPSQDGQSDPSYQGGAPDARGPASPSASTHRIPPRCSPVVDALDQGVALRNCQKSGTTLTPVGSPRPRRTGGRPGPPPPPAPARSRLALWSHTRGRPLPAPHRPARGLC